MPDRLEEIKERYGWTPSLKECSSFDVYHSDLDDHAPDFGYLINVIEQQRKTIDRWSESNRLKQKIIEKMTDKNKHLQHFADEVDKLFENVKRERVGKQ